MPARRIEKHLPPPNLSLPRNVATNKINDQISKGKSVLDQYRNIFNQEVFQQTVMEEDKWYRYVVDMLKRCFDNELYAQEFESAGEYGVVSVIEDLHDEIESHAAHLGAKIAVLESIRDRLPDIQEPITFVRSSVITEQKPILSRNVFVVHGHEHGKKEETARFLSKMKLSPIILHEKPDEGQTIIEKIERHAKEVVFAVIILTPDDEGRHKDKTTELRPRARQNVIYELGYFHGKIGRAKVAVLYIEGVEIPSDYQGVLYIPYDDKGAWRLRLAQEIKQSGVEIDMNDAI